MEINALWIGITLSILHAILVVSLTHKIIPNKLAPMPIHMISGIGVLTILMSLSMTTKINFDLWTAFCILSFSVSMLLFLFSAVYKSLSLRLLLKTYDHHGKCAFRSLDELVTEVSFKERANLLQRMGLINLAGNEYQVSQKGLVISRRLAIIRKLFGVSTRGLYQSTGLFDEEFHGELNNKHDI